MPILKLVNTFSDYFATWLARFCGPQTYRAYLHRTGYSITGIILIFIANCSCKFRSFAISFFGCAMYLELSHFILCSKHHLWWCKHQNSIFNFIGKFGCLLEIHILMAKKQNFKVQQKICLNTNIFCCFKHQFKTFNEITPYARLHNSYAYKFKHQYLCKKENFDW